MTIDETRARLEEQARQDAQWWKDFQESILTMKQTAEEIMRLVDKLTKPKTPLKPK